MSPLYLRTQVSAQGVHRFNIPKKIQVSKIFYFYLYSSPTHNSLMVKNKKDIYRESEGSDFQWQS